MKNKIIERIKEINWMPIIFVVSVLIFFIGMVFFSFDHLSSTSAKDDICKENNGALIGNGFSGIKCVNESGVYEIVNLNGEWRLIK